MYQPIMNWFLLGNANDPCMLVRDKDLLDATFKPWLPVLFVAVLLRHDGSLWQLVAALNRCLLRGKMKRNCVEHSSDTIHVAECLH